MIPTLQRLGQEVHKQASLGYIAKPGGKENKIVNYNPCICRSNRETDITNTSITMVILEN